MGWVDCGTACVPRPPKIKDPESEKFRGKTREPVRMQLKGSSPNFANVMLTPILMSIILKNLLRISNSETPALPCSGICSGASAPSRRIALFSLPPYFCAPPSLSASDPPQPPRTCSRTRPKSSKAAKMTCSPARTSSPHAHRSPRAPTSDPPEPIFTTLISPIAYDFIRFCP